MSLSGMLERAFDMGDAALLYFAPTLSQACRLRLGSGLPGGAADSPARPAGRRVRVCRRRRRDRRSYRARTGALFQQLLLRFLLALQSILSRLIGGARG